MNLTENQINKANDILGKFYLYFPKLDEKQKRRLKEYPENGYKTLMEKKLGISDFYYNYCLPSDMEKHDPEIFPEDVPFGKISVKKDVWGDQPGEVNFENLENDPMSMVKELYQEIGEDCIEVVNEYWKEKNREFLFLLAKNNVFPDEETKKEAFKQSQGLNDNPLRFLAELIQNADDCKYEGRKSNRLIIDFYMDQKKVVLSYPEKGFDFSDVVSLSGINNSGKKWTFENAISTIGEKGRGFKSLYRYFKEIHINSGNYRFYYNLDEANFRQPIYEDVEPYKSGTKITLIPNDENKDGNFNTKERFENLAKDIKRYCGFGDGRKYLFRNNPIFYTKRINELVLNFVTKDKQERLFIKNEHKLIDGNSNNHEEKCWWETNDDTGEHKTKKCTGFMEMKYWEKISAEFPGDKDPEDTPTKAYNIELQGMVLYPNYDWSKMQDINQLKGLLAESEKERQIELLRQKRPIILFGIKDRKMEEQNDPDFEGHIYTFLPTSMNLKIPFIIQMPFELEDNRSCAILGNEWNKDLWNQLLNDETGLLKEWYDVYGKGNISSLPYSDDGENECGIIALPKEIEEFDEKNKTIQQSEASINKLNDCYQEQFLNIYRSIEIFPVWGEEGEECFSSVSKMYILDDDLKIFDQDMGECKKPRNPIFEAYNSCTKSKKKRYRGEKKDIETLKGFYKFVESKNNDDIIINLENIIKVDSNEIQLKVNEQLKKSDEENQKNFSKFFLDRKTWGCDLLDSEKNKNWIFEVAKNNLLVETSDGHFEIYSPSQTHLYFVSKGIGIEGFKDLKDVEDNNNYSVSILKQYEAFVLKEMINKHQEIEKIDSYIEAKNSEEFIETMIKRVFESKNIELGFKWTLMKECVKNRIEEGKRKDISKAIDFETDDLKVICGINKAKEDTDWQEWCYNVWKDEKCKIPFKLLLKGMNENIRNKINPQSPIGNSEKIRITANTEKIEPELEDLVEEYNLKNEDEILKELKKTYKKIYIWKEEKWPWSWSSDYILFHDKDNNDNNILIIKNENALSKVFENNGRNYSFSVAVDKFVKEVLEEPKNAYKKWCADINGKIKFIKCIQAAQIDNINVLSEKTCENIKNQHGTQNDNPLHELLQNFHDQMDPKIRTPILVFIKYDENDEKYFIECAYKEKYHEEENYQGFSPKDILCLVSQGLSDKKKITDATGNKGIGFISLIDLFDYIGVFSNGFEFAFDCKSEIDNEKFKESLDQKKYYNTKLGEFKDVDSIWKNSANPEKSRSNIIPLILSPKEIEKIIEDKYYKEYFSEDNKEDLTRFYFEKDEEPEKFTSISETSCLFLHRCSKIIHSYNDSSKEILIPTYPKTLTLDYDNLDDMYYEDEDDEYKYTIFENRQVEYWGISVKSEDDDSDSDFEVQFVLKDNVEDKEGNFYVSLPLKDKTGGRVHLNIPKLKTDNSRSHYIEEGKDGNENKKIIENVGKAFPVVFNLFAKKYLKEKSDKIISECIYRYVPTKLYQDENLEIDDEVKNEAITNMKLFYCRNSTGYEMKSWNELDEHHVVLEEYMRIWFEKWDPEYAFFYGEDNNCEKENKKIFVICDRDSDMGIESWLKSVGMSEIIKLNHDAKPDWFLDYIKEYIGKKILPDETQKIVFFEWFKGWKEAYRYNKEDKEDYLRIGGEYGFSKDGYTWEYCLYRMFSWIDGEENCKSCKWDYFYFESNELREIIKEKLKKQNWEKKDAYYDKIVRKVKEKWLSCYDHDKDFKPIYDLLLENKLLPKDNDEKNTLEKIFKGIAKEIEEKGLDKQQKQLYKLENLCKNKSLIKEILIYVSEENSISENYETQDNAVTYLRLPIIFYDDDEVGELKAGAKEWVKKLKGKGVCFVSPVCWDYGKDFDFSCLINAGLNLKDLCEPLLMIDDNAAKPYWSNFKEKLSELIKYELENCDNKDNIASIKSFYEDNTELIKKIPSEISDTIRKELLNYILKVEEKKNDNIPIYLKILKDFRKGMSEEYFKDFYDGLMDLFEDEIKNKVSSYEDPNNVPLVIEHFYVETLDCLKNEQSSEIKKNIRKRMLDYIISKRGERKKWDENTDANYIPVYMLIYDEAKKEGGNDFKYDGYLKVWYEEFNRIINDKELMQIHCNKEKTPLEWEKRNAEDWIKYFNDNQLNIRVVLEFSEKGKEHLVPEGFRVEDIFSEDDIKNKLFGAASCFHKDVWEIVKWSIPIEDEDEYKEYKEKYYNEKYKDKFKIPREGILKCFSCVDRTIGFQGEDKKENRELYNDARLIFGKNKENIKEVLIGLINDYLNKVKPGLKFGARRFKSIPVDNEAKKTVSKEEYESIRGTLEEYDDLKDDEVLFNLLASPFAFIMDDSKTKVCGYGSKCPFTNAEPYREEEAFSVFWYDLFGVKCEIPLYGMKEIRETFEGNYIDSIKVEIRNHKEIIWESGGNVDDLTEVFSKNEPISLHLKLTMIPSSADENDSKDKKIVKESVFELTPVHKAIIYHFLTMPKEK